MRGYVFRSKMGELTLHVTAFSMLAKALRPLPDKWHGLHVENATASGTLT